MAKKIVTLYIDDSSLRLMVTRGERIKEWAYLPLDQGIVTNNLVTNESALVSKIKELFKIQKIRTDKVAVGVSGLHCLTRPITLPQLPKEMLDEAVRREARRILPVSPEQLYISWQVLPAPEGKSRVFLVALPCVTVDTFIKALNQAGLKVSFISVKPLLLARIMKEATAIITDVQPTEFDVAIIVNGIPQLIRTVPFAHEKLSLEKKMEIISGELDRAINFLNTSNPEDSLAPDVPILISGELADYLQLCQNLSNDIGHPILPLQSPFEYLDGFAPNLYLANIGLVLHQFQRRTKASSSLVTLNSLPLNYQTKSVSLTNIYTAVGSFVAAGLFAFLIMATQSVAADIDSMRVKLNTAEQALQQTLSQKQSLSGDIEELKNRAAIVQTSYNNFEAALDTIKKQNLRINGDLSLTMESLPGTITLSSISHNIDALEITGKAQTKNDILSYFMELESSNLFGEIVISKMTKAKDGRMDFTLLVNPEKSGTMASGTEAVLRYLPIDVSLISISQAGGVITIDGRSPNEDSIVLFLKKLEDSNTFQAINLNSKTSTEDGKIDFTFSVRTRE